MTVKSHRLLAIVCLLLSALCPSYAQTDPGAVDLSTRESSRSWFNTWWPKTYGVPMGFTGNVAAGIAGDTSQAFKDEVALRVNVFRRMAGVQPVTFSTTYNAKDQQAALMMSVNGQASHSPPSTWVDYTSDGFSAAQQSNLYYGVSGPSAILGYMYDPGAENNAVGHRIAMLIPAEQVMGTGDVPASGSFLTANALWNNDSSIFSTNYQYNDTLIYWPSRGYVPHYLIPGRWSIFTREKDDLSSLMDTDLRSITVKVTKNGQAMNILLSAVFSEAVWTLDGTSEGNTNYATTVVNGETIVGTKNDTQDNVYHVTIDNIKVYPAETLLNGTGHLEYDVVGYNPAIGPVIPTITTQPSAQGAVLGSSAQFSVVATNATNYQWYKEGAALAGATSASLTIANVQASDAGNYYVIVYSASGSTTSSAAALTIVPASTVKLFNISTRSYVGTGDSVQIAGFIINGTQAKKVLVRASGPALTQYGVSGVLADPALTIYSGSTVIGQNDDWGSDTNVPAYTTASGATPFAQGSKDSAIAITLQPGAYTAIVSGQNGGTGVSLVEVFEADGTGSSSKLVNISTRSPVMTGDQVQIAGFIISGTAAKKLLIRANGPALTQYGVSGVLADPTLTLYSGSTVIGQNDDWGTDANVPTFTAASGATAFAPGSKDSAIAVTLQPGAYTAIVSGKNSTTGVSLIEVFEVP